MRLMFLLFLLLTACSSNPDVHETRFIMGTLVEFTIADGDSSAAEQAIVEAAAEMQRIEDTFTIYGDTSNSVKAFNASVPSTPIHLPAEVAQLLTASLTIQKQSNGAFNPALGKLNLLWGFSSETTPVAPPAESSIKQALPPRSCIRQIGRDWARSDANCVLDFGAIAKGYAIDRGIEILKEHGIRHAIINAGGDIRLIGSHHGKPWRIGLRHPRNKGQVLGTLRLTGDISIVTSGDYERYFIHNGQRYHHILDPQTGWPATASQSATVMADQATRADAWSTALFVQGAAGLAAMEKLDSAALTVDSSGKIHMNKAMQGIFEPADRAAK